MTMMLSSASICEWFALCSNNIDGFAEHPVLGLVPTCSRCATRAEQPLARFAVECQNDKCGEQHAAVYDHPGRSGEGPIFAVVCNDGLTDYYTSELLTLLDYNRKG